MSRFASVRRLLIGLCLACVAPSLLRLPRPPFVSSLLLAAHLLLAARPLFALFLLFAPYLLLVAGLPSAPSLLFGFRLLRVALSARRRAGAPCVSSARRPAVALA